MKKLQTIWNMGNFQTDWQGLIFTACLAQGIYIDCWEQRIFTDSLT